MQYRMDPRSGNKLSQLGFGCMRFGGDDMAGSFSGRFDRRKAEELIAAAVDQGINYFDTAYIYAGSEDILGRTLETHHLRDKVYIATKLPLILLKKEEDIEKCFNEELKRLRTDHIDYYLMHMLPDKEEWAKLSAWHIVEWIQEKKKSGQIRQVGFSFHGPSGDFLELLDVYDWDFCQIQLNYSDENYQAGVTGLAAAHEKGLPVMIMEPLLGGKLVNGLPKAAVERFKRTDPDRSSAEWGLRWVWNRPEVTVVLSGMNEMEQLRTNAIFADRAYPGMLTEEENAAYQDVKQIFADSYKVHCTGCHYCMPCPAGVNIPGCFTAYNTYHAINKVTGNFQYTMTTLMVNKPAYASLCKKCGKCEKHCPQHLEIRKELEAVSKDMEGVRFKVQKFGLNILRKMRKQKAL